MSGFFLNPNGGRGSGGSGASIGGAVTSGTAGSVLFVNPDAILAQNNQNFFYNNTSSRLSVYGSLGSEMLTNGSFTGSATGWTVGSGYAYSSNTVVHSSNGTSALSQSISGLTINREYICTFVISAWTVGTVTVSCGGVTGAAIGANGTYSFRFVPTNSNALAFTPTNTSRFTIDTVSVKQLTGGELRTGNVSIDGNWSNGAPGTTRAMSINNAGSYSWLDFLFTGTLRASIGSSTSGGIDFYQSGGNGVSFNTISGGLYSYNYSGYFYHSGNIQVSGFGMFGASIGAGTGAFTTPTSTFQNAGSTALKVKRVTSSQSLDSSATHWLSDATNASACTGTPSVSNCSAYTGSGQATCESHLPCTWFAGSSCSAFSYEYGMGSCSGTGGCSADTAACSGGDEATCLAGDDSYGGSCAWSGNDCSPFNESTCGGTSGCTQNFSDCSAFNGNESACSGQSGCTVSSTNSCPSYSGNESACSMAGGCSVTSGNSCPSQFDEGSCVSVGCSWDGMTCNGDNSICGGDNSTCSGMYFTSCTGTYYTCTGNYYTGNCSGTYGVACNGTVTCTSYTSSGPCGAETGCSWSSVLNLTLPDGETCPDRTYWVYNDASGGADTIIYPYSGQTVNETTSYTLAAYRDWVHFAYYKKTQNCSIYDSGSCSSHTGCTANYNSCSWDGANMLCYGNAVCTGIGDQTSCESTTYFSSCSGIEVLAKNWYKFGS